ncbi:hypothetical protein ACWDA3_55530 [Nonomuraea rubra]
MTDIWPPPSAYALAHRCPTCKADAGTLCTAPRKTARAARTRRDLVEQLHATRQAAGTRHRNRDIGNAPWPDEREPGRRYDTLGDQWQPDQPHLTLVPAP